MFQLHLDEAKCPECSYFAGAIPSWNTLDHLARAKGGGAYEFGYDNPKLTAAAAKISSTYAAKAEKQADYQALMALFHEDPPYIPLNCYVAAFLLKELGSAGQGSKPPSFVPIHG